jgi:hypothetical protein
MSDSELILLGGLLAGSFFAVMAMLGNKSSKEKPMPKARRPAAFQPRRPAAKPAQIHLIKPQPKLKQGFAPKAVVVQLSAYCRLHGVPAAECPCKKPKGDQDGK